MIGILAGQVAKSLAIDHYGLFGSPRRKIDPRRAMALMLIMAALLLWWLWVKEGNGYDSDRFLALCGGALLSVQAAINGRLGSQVGGAAAPA